MKCLVFPTLGQLLAVWLCASLSQWFICVGWNLAFVSQSYNTAEILSDLCMFFQCICIDHSWYFIFVGVPQHMLPAMTDSNDVTLTFLSLLESFLVALMKSLRPCRYSSYSSSVMSPFSTSTCGRWGSEETHSELCHRRHCKYKAGGRCLKVKPSDCLWPCSLPVSAWELRLVDAANEGWAQRVKSILLAVNYSVQVKREHFYSHLDEQFTGKWLKLHLYLIIYFPQAQSSNIILCAMLAHKSNNTAMY